MDFARIAGSVISLWLGGALNDSDTPDTETPDFQINPNLLTDIQSEPVSTPEPALQPAPQIESKEGLIAKWAQNLSPAGQKVVASAMAGGAQGLMQGLAAKNKADDDRDREERKRNDTIRRGQLQAFGPSAFTPRAIIGPRMG